MAQCYKWSYPAQLGYKYLHTHQEQNPQMLRWRFDVSFIFQVFEPQIKCCIFIVGIGDASSFKNIVQNLFILTCLWIFSSVE